MPHRSARLAASTLALLAGVFVTGAVSAQISGLGAMGDSLSDEYAESDYDYALNWMQQLVLFRGINAGQTAAMAGQPNGTWGEPRRTQYRQNWARSGANSSTLLSQGQHTGLASQIQPLEISHVMLAIGANDFAPIPFFGFAYFSIYHNIWSESQQQAFIDDVAGRIVTAMDTVLAEEVHFVLANVPDYGVTPIATAFFPDPVKRERVTEVIADLNTRIADEAKSRKIVLLDIAGLASSIFGTNDDLREVLLLGNIPIYVRESDTSSHANPQAGFVDDGIHPHTTLQGIFANLIALGLNTGSTGEIAPFTEAEILDHAGLAYGGVDTLSEQIGDLASYVIDFTPIPATPGDLNGDDLVDVLDLLALLSEWGQCAVDDPCVADLTDDGLVNVADLLILLSHWG